MEDPTAAETLTYLIMTINMNGKGTSDKRRKLILSTIMRSSASVIFCQEAPAYFKNRVVAKCSNDRSSYNFVPKDIALAKVKVAVMWRETDFESEELDLTQPSITKIVKRLEKEMSPEDVANMVRVSMERSAMVKLTSKGTTKTSFLAVSWCGPYKYRRSTDKLTKREVFHDLIWFVREVCKNEKLSWFIIGGGFNFDSRSKVDLTKHELETIPYEPCTRGKMQQQRGRFFVPNKDTFIFSVPSDKLPITVSEVKPFELENESSKNPLLDRVPVVGVLNLVQDKDTFTEDTSESHTLDKTTNKKDRPGLTAKAVAGCSLTIMDECQLRTVYRAGTSELAVFEPINNDKVWLITNPALYYPLDNRDTKQRQSPKEAVKPTVCLWKTEIHVKCPANGLVIKDHPVFKGVCVVKGKQKVLRKFMGSLSWEKSSVPRCQLGLSMMEICVIDQAVLHFLTHNPPSTPEEFNFHAELKAASEWCWPKDDEPMKRARGPHDDWRLKKVAAIALKNWKEELCQATKHENRDSRDSLEEYISDLEEDIFNLSMYYKGTLEETDDDTLPSIDTSISNGVDRSSKYEKHVSQRRSPRRKLDLSKPEDGTRRPAKGSFHSGSPPLKKPFVAAQ